MLSVLGLPCCLNGCWFGSDGRGWGVEAAVGVGVVVAAELIKNCLLVRTKITCYWPIY